MPQPSRVGAKNATTFKGFCETHDRNSFTLIDGNHLCNTKEQLSQLLHRTVSYEAYWKRWESSPTKQAIDRMMVDRIIAEHEPHEHWGTNRWNEAKTEDWVKELTAATLFQQAKDRFACRWLSDRLVWIERQLKKKGTIDLRAIEIRIKGRPFIACSGLVSARYDFAERSTLDTTRPEHENDTLAVMTTWLHSTKEWSLVLIETGTGGRRIDRYVESLRTRYSQNKWLERLTTWMMVSSGNVTMNPRWWQRIGDHNQMMCGVIQQQHHGDGQKDLTNEYWENPFVGEAEITICHHWL